MAFQRYAEAFAGAGYPLAALSVDPPARAAKLRQDLELSFPLLCDPARATVQAWDLYNRRERGGIAVPATVILAADGYIELFAREAMAQRLRASDVLAAVTSGGGSPVKHGFWPGMRDWWRALVH